MPIACVRVHVSFRFDPSAYDTSSYPVSLLSKVGSAVSYLGATPALAGLGSRDGPRSGPRDCTELGQPSARHPT